MIKLQPDDLQLHQKKNPWGIPAKHTLTAIQGGWLPPLEITTTVHAFVFDEQGRVLMSLETDRGWEIPGGHIDPGESAEQGLIRETIEEGGVKLNSYKHIGRIQIDIHEPTPDTYKYPWPQAHMLFYASNDYEMFDFIATEEDLERKFFDENDFANIPNRITSNPMAIELLKIAKQALNIS